MTAPDRALRRLRILTLAVGAAGSVGMLAWQGVRPAAGFLAGAVLSILNLEGLTRLAFAIEGSERPGPVAAALIALRYVVIGVALYVIVKILGFAPVAVLSGLLTAFGAALLEVLYELWHLGRL